MTRNSILIALAVLLSPCFLLAQQSEQTEAEKFQGLVDRAIAYLKTSQEDDGSFSPHAGPGITALVTTAMMKHGVEPEDPVVAKSLKYLEGFIQPTGGVHASESLYKNYETSVALLCFVEANKDGRYNNQIEHATRFLKGLQWAENRQIESSDHRYGGYGYGKHGRPDLSNTNFTIDALKAVGTDENDPAIQRALVFISRTQNHVSEHNSNPVAAKVNDGGFFYTPFGEGESQAGPTDNGGLRSYASMTYAGLKSMLYAGVDKNDTRVKAAVEWISRNYGLDRNPGMGAQGLYYYYHVFAKALDAVGEDIFVDGNGVKHNWRQDMRDELAKRQQPDGAWVNTEHDRWLENDPNLVTAYALLGLAYCKPK